MPRQSLLHRELRELEKQYGRENVRLAPKGLAVLIDRFAVPALYVPAPSLTRLVLILPEGYGWGMNISDCYIALPRLPPDKPKPPALNHIEPAEDWYPELRASFESVFKAATGFPSFRTAVPDPKRQALYWLCLHVPGDARWQFLQEVQQASRRRGREPEKETPPEDIHISLHEQLSIVRAMLDRLVKWDEETAREVRAMNAAREDWGERERAFQAQFSFARHWRKLPWMY